MSSTAILSPIMTGPFSPASPTSPTPTQHRCSKTPKRKNSKQRGGSISLKSPVTMCVAPDMAYVSTTNLTTQWEYMTNKLISEQHRAEKLVRNLAGMKADHEAGHVKSWRGFTRKMSLVQKEIQQSTEQQNVMMARVNQLALEMRHRQFVYEEQQSRMATPQAIFFQNPFGSPATPYSSPVAHHSQQQHLAFGSINQIFSPIAHQPQPQDVSHENISAVAEAKTKVDITAATAAAREHTPSLQSEDSWDSMVEQDLEERQALVATAMPACESLSSSSCPASPRILAADDSESNLDLAAVNDAFTSHKRRQSICILSATEQLTL